MLGLGLECRVRVRVGFRYTVSGCRKYTQGEARPYHTQPRPAGNRLHRVDTDFGTHNY